MSNRKYPRFGRIEFVLKGPSSLPCCICGDPAWRNVSIEINYFRGEDVIAKICNKKECLTDVRKNPIKGLKGQIN